MHFFRFIPIVIVLSMAQLPASAQVPNSKRAYLDFALKREGDPIRGKLLFLSDKLACARCHSIDGSASKAGPDLYAVGDKFGRQEIIEAILFPSKSIAVGYSSLLLTTDDGEQHIGILKSKDNEGLKIMDASGTLQTFQTSRIKEQRFLETSLMPDNLEGSLSTQEFTDVVEFMVTLKQPASATQLAHGMPSEIDQLDSPVSFIPIHSEKTKFNHPVWMAPLPGQPHHVLVLEHEQGKLWVLDRENDSKSLFLDIGTNVIAGGTRGMIGAALHPDFEKNGRYYFVVSLAQTNGTHSIVFEREAAPNRRVDSGKPSREIINFEATSNVHYGGGLAFGPDRFLYIGMGDTGPQGDPHGHGQDLGDIRGKMLRIDVDHRDGNLSYRIPKDNPFVGHAGIRPEIWAYGFREPWRFSFDSVTGQLWVGDVGQDRYEEVDLVEKGRNYGWNVYEGFEPFSNQYRRTNEVFHPPVFAYARKFGPSVTGGFVYRADRKSSFYGAYIFGDYESKRLFAIWATNGKLDRVKQIGVSPQRIVSLSQDSAGNLYIIGYEGTIYQIDLKNLKI